MALFPKLYGNAVLKSKLAFDIKNKSLPHALIIEGARGSGRALLAKSICACLACRENAPDFPCGECEDCRKIYSDICPDVITVERAPDKATISVETVRAVIERTYLSSNSLPFKAFIINDADRLTPQAQNAFLKSLEEPATEVYYFLICENSSSLLPTILSRAPVIRTAPLSAQDIKEYIRKFRRQALFTDAELDKIVLSAEGSLSRALKIADGVKEVSPLTERVDTVLKYMEAIADRAAKAEFLSSLGSFSDREEMQEFLRLLYSALRDIIAVKKCSGVEMRFYSDRNLAGEHARKIRLRSAFALLDIIDEASDELSGNTLVQNCALNFGVRVRNAL